MTHDVYTSPVERAQGWLRPIKRPLLMSLFMSICIAGLSLHAQAQCVEPELEEAAMLSSMDLSVISPEEALSREAGDWSFNEHVSGGLSPQRYLRALALDLMGRLPSSDELAQLQEAGGAIDPIMIDQWLNSPEFASQMVRFVRGQLWNNISDLNLYQANASLSRSQDRYWLRNPALRSRGDRVPCLDEPAQFDESGAPIQFEQEDGTMREGWVWVNPYWAPDTQVKVCALDALTNERSSNGAQCGTNGGLSRVDCGCGENLKWCVTGQVRREMAQSLTESLDLLVAHVFSEPGSFLRLFEERRFFINGPLVHFFNYHLNLSRYTLAPSPLPEWQLPQLPYTTRDQWSELILDQQHAGVLTHPAFLLRFQTNRARAGRFYETFLCSPFQPPEGGLPVASEESVRNPDLQERAGCKYCHALLEPAASYWGRWMEQGVAYLDTETFPAERDECVRCALSGSRCSGECDRYYLTEALNESETPFLGKLKAYNFIRDQHTVNIERGPRLLVYSEVAGQRLPRCVAQRAAEWFLGREMSDAALGDSANGVRDRAWLDKLGVRFARNGYRYRDLIKDIISDERYRRVK